jgi:hypothetical protein
MIKNDSRVVFHGTLDNKKLEDLYVNADVGLTAFSLVEKGMKQACSLKCREYLKNGLIVYSGHEDVFPQAFPYYRLGAPDIGAILTYFEANRGLRKSVISKCAQPFIDKEVLLRDLYDWVTDIATHQS